MKKILIYLLLLVHLFTGLAFAMDTHPEAVANDHPAAIDLLTDSDHDHPESSSQHEDHCGHAAAHLVGLIFDQTTTFIACNNQNFFVSPQTPIHLYIAPLLRPPIV